MPSSSIWGTHLDSLRHHFPGRVQVLSVSAEEEHFDNLIIVQKLRVIHSSGWDVQILLPEGFPDDKPLILFAGYKCPFRWAPPDTMLHEAVDHAVSSLEKLSGGLGPINLNQVSNEIAQSNPEQCEAALQADSLKAFVDQSIFGIGVQKELDVVWDAIEDTCKKNLEMQPQITQLQQDVMQLQHQVKTGLAGLGSRRKDVLDVLPLGSSDGLVRSAKEELKELEEAATMACKALGSVSASKNLVENMKRKKRQNRLQQQQQQNAANSSRSRSPQSTTTTGVHMSFNSPGSTTTNQQQQQQAGKVSFESVNNTATENNNNETTSTQLRQSGSTEAVDNNNNNNNNNMMFVVPDLSASSTTPQQTNNNITNNNNNNTNPSTALGSTGISGGSVFSSVAQQPLSFNLEKNNNRSSSAQNNNTNDFYDYDNDDENNTNHMDDEDDEDDEDDVMDKAVDYAMKVCMEARKAAMMLRRFSAQ